MPNFDRRYDYSDDSSSFSPDESSEEEEEEEVTNLNRSRDGRGWRFWGTVLDPRATWVQEWNRLFLLVCAVGLFVDPLFFYTLSISESCMCLFVDGWFAVTVTVIRCMIDALHLWNVWLQFKMNRGHGIRMHGADGDGSGGAGAYKYFKSGKGFVFDLFVILPLPQVRLLFIFNYCQNREILLVQLIFGVPQNCKGYVLELLWGRGF